ncbi:MAG TPA: PfkB family carbohydrate kinase [Pseudonocardiaceae bacterium]|jgi:sugar/nucleoside kinase (ribokinase family)|nr:PfkB family carbohydrate kinase [Pseudonocardiaceae bacterium]
MTHPVRIQPAERAYRALNNPVQPAECGPDVLATLATVNVDGDVGKELLMPPRGLFVGVTTLDVVQRVARRPGVDEKVVAQRSDIAAGGPAAAAAITFGALGGRSVLLSALGPGPIGRLVAGKLAEAGVQVVDAWAAGADLSISAITVLDSTGQRSVVSRNAQDLTAVVPAGLPALVRAADVVLIDGHHPDLALAAARAAQTAGIPVVLDCGSAKPVYAGLVPLAVAAVCSADFTVHGSADFDAVSTALLADGAGLVAMTAGSAPVRWRTWEAAGTVEVPAVAARDTLGAGDVLHGAVAFARARGVADPQRSLSFGVAVASLRVQHVGPRIWMDDQRLGALVAQL